MVFHFQQPILSEVFAMRKAFFVASVFMSAMLLSPAVYASVSDDQVTSQKIKEADGTSGQNTNSGSGVKTNHLQNAAVTTPKIADGAVSTLKLLNGAVTAQKLGIVCPDGQYLQFTLAGGWACSVGTPGPAGPMGPQGLTGPAGPQPRYANVVVVAKSGGDFTDPAAAMDAITDASSMNPYLVKVMPGVYDIGSASVIMKPFVDLEGSGQAVTTIQGSSDSGTYKTVTCASNTGIRDVTVIGRGGGSSGYGTAIYLNNANPVYISRVAASASHSTNVSGGTAVVAINCESNSNVFINDSTVSVDSNINTKHGIFIYESTATLDDVSVTVKGSSNDYAIFGYGDISLKSVTASAPSGTGVFVRNLPPGRSRVRMDGVNVTGSFLGVNLSDNTDAEINNSSITGPFSVAPSSVVFAANTKITGQISVWSALLKCIGVYDANYDPVVCP